MGRNRVCAIYGCTPKDDSLKLFSFPRDKVVCAKWLRLCGRADFVNVNTARICSKHFSNNQLIRNLKVELLRCNTPINYRPLKKDSFPDLHLPLASSLPKKKIGKCKLLKFCKWLANLC